MVCAAACMRACVPRAQSRHYTHAPCDAEPRSQCDVSTRHDMLIAQRPAMWPAMWRAAMAPRGRPAEATAAVDAPPVKLEALPYEELAAAETARL